MNVLILTNDEHNGGLVRHTKILSKGLTNFENDRVVVGCCPGEPAEIFSDTVAIERVNWANHTIKGLLDIYNSIAAIVKKYNIDIIHCQNRFPALIASLFCFFHRRVKYIWANHLVPIPSSLLFRIMTRYGKFAVAESSEEKFFLAKNLRIPENKIRVINLGVELDRFVKIDYSAQRELKCRLGIPESNKVIMLYGMLVPHKGHLFLLEALAKLSYSNYSLIFPGKETPLLSDIKAYTLKHNLSERVVLPGFINGPEVLSICDLMILPSYAEGFPQACVEAYAMGVPVIRTKTGGYIDTQDMCWGVEYGDVNELTRLLSLFFSGSPMFKERADKAIEHVGRLSLHQMSASYHKLYKEALKS